MEKLYQDPVILSYIATASECKQTNRADAFFFHPLFKQVEDVLQAIPPDNMCSLESIAKLSSATVDPRRKSDEEFIYVEIESVSPAIGEIVHWSTVVGENAPSRARKIIQPKSILVSTVRPYRRATALSIPEVEGGVCSTGFSVIQPFHVTPEYLWAFLRGKHGGRQLERLGRGASYPALSEKELASLLIVKPSTQLQREVSERVKSSQRHRQSALKHRTIAIDKFEAMLENHQSTSKGITSIIHRSDVSSYARLDANFFSPMFKTLDAALHCFGKTLPLSHVVRSPVCRGKQPEYDEDGTVPVLKTIDIQNDRVHWDVTRKVTAEFAERNPQATLGPGDIVVTTTGIGSWGKSAICDVSSAVAAVDLVVIRPDTSKIDPLVLLAFFWSRLGRLQFQQRPRGSTRQTHLYERDMATVRVPLLSDADADCVKTEMQAYFSELKEADNDRAQAVRAVEAYVEELAK